MTCGVGHRRGSDSVLLWLCCRSAAVALIRPLAWEPSHIAGAALKSGKKKKKQKILLALCPCEKHGHPGVKELQEWGAPAVLQGVKNLTAAAWVNSEARFQSLAWGRGVKDTALAVGCSSSSNSIPGPGNFPRLQVRS